MRQLFLLLLMISLQQATAQTVSNLHFSQESKQIVVTYDLSGNRDDIFLVSLYCSQDGGSTWDNPLKNVSGDAGNNVKTGTGKTITWDVLGETEKLVGEIRFKVEIINKSACNSFTVAHNAGSVAPVNKTVTYGVVESNLSGSKKCWITQNLGADRQATSANDNSEASAGWYWQFNRKQGYKHDGNKRTPKTRWIFSISENSDWLPANDPCSLLLGNSWRIPTENEWKNTDAFGAWDNFNVTYTSVLNLHAAGYLFNSVGSISNRGSNGLYWSSLQSSLDYGWNLYFDSGNCLMSSNNKAGGFSARCLRDN